MIKRMWLVLIILVLYTTEVFSAVRPPIARAPEPDQPPWFTGYIDASVNYMLRSNHFANPTPGRLYDYSPDSINFNQVAFTLSELPDHGLGGLLNIVTGREANATAAYGWNPYFGSSTLALDPFQLFAEYNFTDATFMVGKFQSLAGYENVDPTLNTQFSTSLIGKYSEPTTHTGVRLTYQLNKQWKMIAGLNDGWDTIRDWTRQKTVELAMSYLQKKYFYLEVQTYSGGQRAEDRTATGPQSMRNLVDVILHINQDAPLKFVFNYDYAIQTKALLPTGQIAQAIWQGAALYAIYQINDRWLFTTRGEFFNDPYGYRTGTRQALKELTLCGSYYPNKNIILRFESRFGFSNVNSYLLDNGSGTRSNQQFYGIQGIYQFA